MAVVIRVGVGAWDRLGRPGSVPRLVLKGVGPFFVEYLSSDCRLVVSSNEARFCRPRSLVILDNDGDLNLPAILDLDDHTCRTTGRRLYKTHSSLHTAR